MPVDETKTLNVTCDNPACPGNDLDPTDRYGWLFVNSEVYGQPTQQHVFCSAECVSAATASDPAMLVGKPEARAELPDAPATPETPATPEPSPSP